MGIVQKIASWFGAKAEKKRATINGAPLEKILVFAPHRDADVNQMMMVMQDPRLQLRIEHGLQCSTEQWTPAPGKKLIEAVQEVADEVAAKFPDFAVTALSWPGSDPQLIVAIVTVGAFDVPLALRNHLAVR